jgi:hypothetical protein
MISLIMPSEFAEMLLKKSGDEPPGNALAMCKDTPERVAFDMTNSFA